MSSFFVPSWAPTFSGLDLVLEESRQQQAAITLRTAYVSRETGMPLPNAQRVALFTLGKWAERYPHRPDDLGEDAAVFFAQWCLSRHVEPTENVLHEALQLWRMAGVVESLGQHTERHRRILEVLAALSLQGKPGDIHLAATRAAQKADKRNAP